MSYDIYLEMDAGGPRPMSVEVGNYTSNAVPIWTQALYGKSLADYDGREARTVVEELEFGLEQIDMYPERFRDLEPENGWGDLEGATQYLRKLKDMCLRYPLAKIRISR